MPLPLLITLVSRRGNWRQASGRACVRELAPGLWSWTARHPEWQEEFGWEAEVRCFYLETDDATLVVDPLVPADDADPFWRALDRDVERRPRLVAVSVHTGRAGAQRRRRRTA